jgi:hypothetical protein
MLFFVNNSAKYMTFLSVYQIRTAFYSIEMLTNKYPICALKLIDIQKYNQN